MQKITVSGNSISISNGVVIVNGKRIDLSKDEKQFTIEVQGNVEKLEVDVAEKITINGDVTTVQSTNGNVTCHDIKGSVSTVNGDVRATSIAGPVSTVNGDIN